MFGIGVFEMLIIALLVLIFIKPKDMPNFFFKIGKLYQKAVSAYQTAWREINTLKGKVKEWRSNVDEFLELQDIASRKAGKASRQRNDKIKRPKKRKSAKKTAPATIKKPVKKTSVRKTSTKKISIKKTKKPVKKGLTTTMKPPKATKTTNTKTAEVEGKSKKV